MNEEDKKELENQLKRLLKDSSLLKEENLESKRRLLDNLKKNQAELYANSIRNLGVISGVVAPLSLALLTATKIDVNTTFLLIGFALLMINIVFSQLVLDEKLESEARKLNIAEMEWFSASFNKKNVDDETKDLTERVNNSYEFFQSTEKIDQLLGLKPFDIHLLETIGDLRKYNRYINALFFIGCMSIVTSTFFNLLLSLVQDFWLK